MLKTLLVAMTPVLEIRGAIPVGLAAGLSPAAAYIMGVIGNILPVPVLILLTRKVLQWLKSHGCFHTLTEKLETKADKNALLIQKYGFWGLVLLVAVPLPGTGAWTGCLVASMLNLRLRAGFPAIMLGVCIAGGIVLAASWGVISGLN